MSLNNLIAMDHEVGKSTSPPKLLKVADYPSWKERFENFARFNDIRMWMCIIDGYVPPSVEVEGSIKVTSYSSMKDEDKKMFEAENKAYSAITMCLPLEILHTFKRYRTAKDLWEALEKRYEGNVQVKKGRAELLKAQFMVFKHMKNESLEDLITRFYHLMTELDSNSITYTDTEKSGKLLDALPPKWDLYTVMIKENEHYSEWDLETVIGKLRAYDLNIQRKETSSDLVQDPSIYHGRKSSSTANSTEGVTAFFSGQTETGNNMVDSNSNCYYMGSSGDNVKGTSSSTGNSSKIYKSMPMSVKSAEEQLSILAAFVASYESYIQGKITDPAIWDEDYDQVDPDDLEEMDLQWQFAMITRRAKRFMNRTGKKLFGCKVGFDKSKVKCYNCNGFGHFARECQRPKSNQTSAPVRQSYSFQGSSSQSTGNQSSGINANSSALVVTQQDGSYEWSTQLNESGQSAQAFIAEIIEEKQEEREAEDVVQVEAEEKAEKDVPQAESGLVKLESTENMNSEEFIAYMANLDAANQKVLLDLKSVVNVCITCTDLAGRVESLVESNRTVSAQLNTLKEENALLKQRGSELKTKQKDNDKDLKVLQIKVNEQQQIIDLAYETLEDRTRSIADKQKELADAQVKIVELNRKLEQFRNSSFTLNHLINSQRQFHDVSGLGYNEVPPPFNENYSFLPKEEDLTCFDYSTTTDVPPKTVNIPEQVTFVKEGDMTNDSPVLDSESNESVKEKQTEECFSPSTTETGESSDPKAPLKKVFKKRTCFTCHAMGHVASCCPTRKGGAPSIQVRKAKPSVPTGNNQEKTTNSQKNSPEKPLERSAGNGNKSGLGNHGGPQFQSSQSRFFPPRNDRPRSNSPRTPNSSGQSRHSPNSQRSHAPHRYQPPHRSPNRFQNVANNHCCQDNRFQRQGSNYRNFNNSNTNYQSRFQQRHHGYSQFPRVSKSPDRCNGYLKEFTFVDENGRSKTVMAWVPRDN